MRILIDLPVAPLRLYQLLTVLLADRSRIIRLDEPDAGLDPRSRRLAHQLIADALRSGVALILTSHNPGFVTEVGEYATVDAVEIGICDHSSVGELKSLLGHSVNLFSASQSGRFLG